MGGDPVNDPIYRPPMPPLTKDDVDRIIDAKIAERTRQVLRAIAGGAVLMGVLASAVVAL